MHPNTHYVMRTTAGHTYELDSAGAVLARSNGPAGHDYSGQWVILGASTRLNSNAVFSLDSIARGGVPGQGWISDRDHGTMRRWAGGANGRMVSLRTV